MKVDSGQVWSVACRNSMERARFTLFDIIDSDVTGITVRPLRHQLPALSN